MSKNTEVKNVRDARIAALESVNAALDALTETYDGNRADALHAVVYGHDVTTRMYALYRYIAHNADEPGQAHTVTMRYGGYEFTFSRQEGRPDCTLDASPEFDLIDRDGTVYGKYAYKPDALSTGDLTQMVKKLCPVVGRVGHVAAQSVLTKHEPVQETTTPTRTRKPSVESERIAALEKQLAQANATAAQQTALMSAIAEKLGLV